MGKYTEVSDSTFDQEVLHADLPVLVDFWAPWCHPCRIVAPVVEEIAEDYNGKLKVAKVNTDDNPNRATQLGIRGIPTLILFKNGQEAERVVGAVPKQRLVAMLEKVVD